MKKENLSNLDLVAGLDEVGMGCIAGPITVGVAVFKESDEKIDGVKDSKKLSSKKRKILAKEIKEKCALYSIFSISAQDIDMLGIRESWRLAVEGALIAIPKLKILYIDGEVGIDSYKGNLIVEPKADDKYWQVSAASILAKEARDTYMERLKNTFPNYLFEKHKGYGTKIHYNKIREHGDCSQHRKTFLKKFYQRESIKEIKNE